MGWELAGFVPGRGRPCGFRTEIDSLARAGIAVVGAAGIRTQERAACRKGGRTAAAGRTLDLLRACRRTSVRTSWNRPAYSAFSLKPTTVGRPRVRVQSDTTQTYKPTAHTKKTCKRRPSRERLKGFEPSTFCMASRRCGPDSVRKVAGTAEFRPAARSRIPRLSPGNH